MFLCADRLSLITIALLLYTPTVVADHDGMLLYTPTVVAEFCVFVHRKSLFPSIVSTASIAASKRASMRAMLLLQTPCVYAFEERPVAAANDLCIRL